MGTLADDAARRKRTAYLAGGIFVIALVVVAGLVLVSQAGDDADVNSRELFADVEQSGVALGEATAPVSVVEFADLQCPFCRDFALNELPGIVEDYVRTGDVRMELQLLDFIGEDSTRGQAVAAAAAEQDRIWPFAEHVYSNQERENSGYMTTDFLEEQARGIPGLDAEQAVADSQGPAARRYASVSSTEAQNAGVESTPSFLVTGPGGDGKLVDADGLREAIDDALAQAEQ